MTTDHHEKGLTMTTPPALNDSAFIDVVEALTRRVDFSSLAHLLSTNCVSALDARAAGVMIKDQSGGLRVVGASDEDTRCLELFEIQSHEGPCYQSAVTGQVVSQSDVAQNTSWPAFRSEALALGYRSAIAVPLQMRSQVIGALNVFWANPQSFSEQTIRFAQALADLATMGLMRQDNAVDAHDLAVRLEDAAQSRITIEQAKGMLSVQGDLGMNESFALMNAFSQRTGRPLHVLAEDVIARRVRAADMTN